VESENTYWSQDLARGGGAKVWGKGNTARKVTESSVVVNSLGRQLGSGSQISVQG